MRQKNPTPLPPHKFIFYISKSIVFHETTSLFMTFIKTTSDLIISVKRAFASKLRDPGFKSRPGTVGGPVTIIM